ncbi:MAG: hypothetical protein RI897_4584 [Verrucomicrobiota bacterium]
MVVRGGGEGMAKLNVPPTKSNLLVMRRQLEFAQEGYDLLDQKRQILVMEVLARVNRLAEVQRRLSELLAEAYDLLREVLLEHGSEELERAVVGIGGGVGVELDQEHLMGLRLPRLRLHMGEDEGVVGELLPARVWQLSCRLRDLIPVLLQVAEQRAAVVRVAAELRKTQRRCNALAKVWIPVQRETLDYIEASLEEREREFLVMLKRVRERLRAG